MNEMNEMPRTSPSCPRCSVPMFSATANTTLALGCRRCGGIMIDRSSASKMVDDSETQALAAQTAAASEAAAVDTSQEGIPCPYCQLPMDHARLFGVDVDVCPTHGTWFDRDELRQIATEAVRLRRGRLGGAAVGAVAGAVVLGGAASIAGAGAIANAEIHTQAQRQALYLDGGGAVAEVAVAAVDVVDVGVVAADGAAMAADVVGAGAEVAAEGAGVVFSVVLEVIGAIFSG